MKRLFQVTDVRNNSRKAVEGEYYDKKPAAKAKRDALNAHAAQGKDEDFVPPFHVSKGPDHSHYRG